MKKLVTRLVLVAIVAMTFAPAKAEAASWWIVKWAQCYRLGGAYCR